MCFRLKPYWLSKDSLTSLKYEDNWVKIIFSSTIDIVANREIGLYFYNGGSSFLKLGITLAILSLSSFIII